MKHRFRAIFLAPLLAIMLAGCGPSAEDLFFPDVTKTVLSVRNVYYDNPDVLLTQHVIVTRASLEEIKAYYETMITRAKPDEISNTASTYGAWWEETNRIVYLQVLDRTHDRMIALMVIDFTRTADGNVPPQATHMMHTMKLL